MNDPEQNPHEDRPAPSLERGSAFLLKHLGRIAVLAVVVIVAAILFSHSYPLALVIVIPLVAGGGLQLLLEFLRKWRAKPGTDSIARPESAKIVDSGPKKDTDAAIRKKIENMGFRSGMAATGNDPGNVAERPLDALQYRFGEIEAEFDGAKRHQALMEALAECVLEYCGVIAQVKLSYNVWKADATAGAEFVISVGFNREDLARWFAIHPDTALEGIREALESHACGALGETEQDKTDIRCCVKWEVWVSPVIESRNFVWNVKQVVPNGKRVKYVAHVARDAGPLPDGNPVEFNHWSWRRESGWSSWQTRFLLGSEERDLVVGPRDERCPTALIDFHHPKLCFVRKFPDIFKNKRLQKELQISVVEEVTAFLTPHDTVIRELKGSVRLKGYWRQGNWQPSESFQLRGEESDSPPESRHRFECRLSTAAPNRLLKAVGEALDDSHGDRQNRILADVLNRAEAPLGSALFEKGNFTIYRERRDSAENSPSIWVMERLPDAVTEFFVPELGDDRRFERMDAFGEAPVAEPSSERVPLSFKDTFYVKTGGADRDGVHLCLEFDLGSPAQGQGSRGMTTYGEESPKLTLEAFARRKGVEAFEHLDSKNAQGFLARGKIPNAGGERHTFYFKLLEAAHLNHYYTSRIFGTLRQAGVIPPEVTEEWCNGHGQTVRDGAILIFSTPEYETVSEALLTGTLDSEDRRLLCRQLALFSRKTLDAEVVCTDFSLDDTVIVPPSLDEFRKAARSDPEKSLLFVADYGAYCQKLHFSIETRIYKGQYQTPEDIDTQLESDAESNQVFVLGALFLEVLLSDPGQVPGALIALRTHGDGDRFEREIADQIAEYTGNPLLAEWRDLITRMFRFRPEDRPRLREVLNDPVLKL